MNKVRVSMDQLSRIATKLFLAMGYNEKEAAYATDVLVETDRRGIDSHGMARLPFYYRTVFTTEKVKKDAELIILRDEPPYLMVDADHGLGIIMAPQAVELAIAKAKENGCCVMGIQNSNHFAAAGVYAAKCVNEGFITLVSSNSPGILTPVGGAGRILGNSPWSLAVPGGNRHPHPVMFDMATSEVALGKVQIAIRGEKEVPQGWGVDKDGAPATDPNLIFNGGSLLPFGGIKGYCLTVMIEILSSMLTFSSYGNGKNMSPGIDNTSHFVLLLDPARFGDLETYRESIDVYVDSIKNAPLAAGVEEIIVPGELEVRAIEERSKNGMELNETIVASLVDTALKLGQLVEGQGFDAMLAW
ncbi:MAG: Ldh family oxidoreductase [Coriobacteriia bacterium]|nr:Ldh family oxidoreductase [Coriobacteriia bacterium]